MIFDEIFGKNPPGEPYGFGHYGWAIWGAIFGISIIMGIVFQAKHIKLRSKQGKIWLGVFAVLILTVVFFIRLAMPTEFGA